MAATAADASHVTITDEAKLLTWYERTPEVHYGFCRQCGSSLFWRATNKPQHLSITAGTLDQPTGLRTTLALFGDEAGDYHHLDTAIETLAGDRDLSFSDD